MKTFNENDFLLDLEDSIASENPEDVWEMIHQTIDTECIYYSNCFDIVKTLNYRSWEDMNDYGEIKNITQLAFVALHEFVSENINLPV